LATSEEHALTTAITVIWIVFWGYWLISAFSAKQGSSAGARGRPIGVVVIIAGWALERSVGRGPGVSSGLEVAGLIVLVAGLGLAVWARVHLGRNWGMPMTLKAEPELVTSGPYRLVRHPIYSGILLGLLGTALAIGPLWFIVPGAVGAYFVYCARVEERIMASEFPDAYPPYRARTTMVIPFLL
jgi:protein-S-isoprenylcysteine O-methyltransferase Ste14